MASGGKIFAFCGGQNDFSSNTSALMHGLPEAKLFWTVRRQRKLGTSMVYMQHDNQLSNIF